MGGRAIGGGRLSKIFNLEVKFDVAMVKQGAGWKKAPLCGKGMKILTSTMCTKCIPYHFQARLKHVVF